MTTLSSPALNGAFISMASSTALVTTRNKTEVAAAIEAIRTFHTDGLNLQAKGHRAQWPRGEGQSSQAEHRRKAREFARLYSPEDLTELFTLCRQHAYPLGVTALKLLIRAKDPAVRGDLQRQAIEQRWSNAKLTEEILNRCSTSKSHAGKHLKTPETLPQAYGHLKKICRRWKSLKQALDRSSLTLNPAVAQAMDEATTKIGELDALISNRLRKVQGSANR